MEDVGVNLCLSLSNFNFCMVAWELEGVYCVFLNWDGGLSAWVWIILSVKFF